MLVMLSQVRPLEMFFPFDPYLLRRSARFLSLASSYNTWGGNRRGLCSGSHDSSDDELEVLGSMLLPLANHSSSCHTVMLSAQSMPCKC